MHLVAAPAHSDHETFLYHQLTIVKQRLVGYDFGAGLKFGEVSCEAIVQVGRKHGVVYVDEVGVGIVRFKEVTEAYFYRRNLCCLLFD